MKLENVFLVSFDFHNIREKFEDSEFEREHYALDYYESCFLIKDKL